MFDCSSSCRHDRLFPLEFMRRLSLERLNIVADVIDTGHLVGQGVNRR
jgi:hypothetical protein